MIIIIRSHVLLRIQVVTMLTILYIGIIKTPPAISNEPSSNARSPVPREPAVPAVVREDYEYCNTHNFVMGRADALDQHDQPPERPYSITSETFASFHERPAATKEEFLRAVKLGRRRWQDPRRAGSETHQSYFVPEGYDVPFLTAAQSCEILGRYSHVFVVGDSHTRQLRMGVFMLLTQNLVSGGIISTRKSGPKNPYDRCRCDGQFSEHFMCRKNQLHFKDMVAPREHELCPRLTEAEQFRFSDSALWETTDCENPDSRPVALYLQGGVHHGSRANDTMAELVEPAIASEGFVKCLRHGKVRVIWASYNAQSRSLDEKYPPQRRENALRFNVEMEEHWGEHAISVTILDWWNLTADAQTSDGFHYLSDVNVVKAVHLLHALSWVSHG